MLNFFRAPFFLSWLYPTLMWRIETSARELYLTFDDGPVPGPTEFVLEELRKWNAKATFFCIGENVKRHPQLFNKVVEGGHTIGNHTFNHLSGWKAGPKVYLDNIRRCDDQIKLNHPGYPVFGNRYSVSGSKYSVSGSLSQESSNQQPAPSPQPLFRPPYGRITRSQIKSLVEYKIVMWEVLTHDYAQTWSAVRCLSGSIAAARPGSIVVFHDSLKAEKNMTYVLPRFMEHFANLGYTFKSLH